MAEATARDLEVTHAEVELAGTLWLPGVGSARALVLMYPGSGPSDRHNDGYFAPIREIFLAASCGVASFDKRGVGASQGDWRRAPIEVQAGDLLAALRALQAEDEIGDIAMGLFGHSQGGWVVLEAASRTNAVDFVITSSGPGVTPAVQERYSARRGLERTGASAHDMETALRDYDEMVALARAGVAFGEVPQSAAAFLPGDADAEDWKFWISILDYDPRGPLRRISVPLLSLWGEADRVVPVDESIEVFRAVIPPTRLTVEVFEDADHRLQVGDPPRLSPGYASRIESFLDANL